MVAGYAAKELAQRDLEPGRLTIISSDTALPYERPPLSKGVLAGKEEPRSAFINDEAFYREHGIDVRLNTRVESIDVASRTVKTDGGELTYGQLVLATGARARELDIPGGDLPCVHYLRSLDDSLHIREAATRAKRAVVIGGGFIGMETAAVLRDGGAEVTLLFPDDRVWKRLFTPEISAFFTSYYTERGVTVAPGEHVKQIEAADKRARLRTSSGRTLEADIVIAGVGAEPNVDLARAAGLRVDNGVVVNEYLETSAGSGVYAAGDIARYRDLLYGKQRRVEHWDNAVEQGKHLARTLTGDRAPFIHVPYFFSDVFDLSYEFWGDTDGADDVAYRGDPSTRSFSAWWLRRNTVVAAFVMDRPDEERDTAPRWIAEREYISPRDLEAVTLPK
jgi:NADPH-dependent 2,4-dienoyl-CoA reductase/sulfur reductase-like enzyme